MDKLVFEHVNKKFGKVTALNDFSLNVKEHELIVILGTSGSGKTTLLRIIAGLDSNDSGEIYLNNEPLDTLPIRERKTALVFQSYALYPQMTAYQNLTISLKQNIYYKPVLKNGVQVLKPDYERIDQIKQEVKHLNKNEHYKEKKLEFKKQIKELKHNPSVPVFAYQSLTKEEIEDRLDKVKKMLELESFLGQRTSTLSGGQKQRVALAKALLKEPDILLLDEPLSNIDAKLRASSRELIRRIHSKTNATTIISTHDQKDAYALADRVVILDEGKVQQVGTIDEVYNKPANITAAKFLGSPSINLMNCFFDGEKLLVDNFEQISISLNQEQKTLLRNYLNNEIILGIRPEDIQICEKGLKVNYLKNEIYGKDFLHHISINDYEILIKSKDKIKPNTKEIEICFNQDKLLFFDITNETNIRSR